MLSLLWVVLGLPLSFLLLILAILGYLGFMQVYNNWRYYTRYNLKTPYIPAKPIIGSFRGFSDPVEVAKHMEKLGTVVYSTMLHLPIFLCTDADIVHYALLKEAFPKGSSLVKNVIDFWGENMVILNHREGTQWKRERRLTEPAFKMSALKVLTDNIFGPHAQKFTQLIQKTKQSESFNIVNLFSSLTMEILSTSGFSYPIELLKDEGQNPFLQSIQAMIRGIRNPVIFLPNGGKLNKRIHQKDNDQMNDVFYKVIDERLAERQKDPKNNRQENPRDLLDLLLNPDEEGNLLTREQLRNELFLFYLAGHDTTATFLSWFIYVLCTQPDVAGKVYDEIDSLIGLSDGKTLVSPTSDQLEEMVYTKMTLNETLRYYPPAPTISRQIPETFEMKGHVFPKGASINFPIYALHRNPAYWPNPEKFDPERFSKENSAERHAFAFMPFGAGNRICLGRKFFMNEALVIIGTVLREIKFELDTTKENGVHSQADPVFKPTGVWVRAHRRIHPTKQSA